MGPLTDSKYVSRGFCFLSNHREQEHVCICVHMFSVRQELIFRQAHSNFLPVVPEKRRLNCTFTFFYFPQPCYSVYFFRHHCQSS